MKTTIKSMLIAALLPLGAFAQSWNITGNAGTNGGTNFIGTTDSKNFKIRTNNAVRMNITNTGKVAIGNFTPVFKLDVTGSINTDSLYRIGGSAVLSIRGTNNFFAGKNSGIANTSGFENTAIGNEAMYFNTTGSYNTATGSGALHSGTGVSANTAYGWGVLNMNRTGSANTAAGMQSLMTDTSGAYNTAYGAYTLLLNKSGDNNTVIGQQSMSQNLNGSFNTACGSFALWGNTSGNYNTACGYEALEVTTTAQYNTAFGYKAGDSFNNGMSNLFLGAHSDVLSAGLFNVIAVGQSTQVAGSNTARFGNSATGSYGGFADWTNVSDGRFKKNIKENVPGIEFISKLRPVTYTLAASELDAYLHKNAPPEMSEEGKKVYDQALKEKEQVTYTGFIAQEVETAARDLGFDFSGVDKPDNDNDTYGLRYAEFTVPLVKAVQELNEKSKNSEIRSQKLEEENEKLKLTIATMQSAIEKLQNTNHNTSSSSLEQNSPNPFSSETAIKFQLPAKFNSALLVISDEGGKQIRTYTIQSSAPLIIKAGELPAAMYSYSLIVDGITVDSKQMILTK